jgi:hypothetical protein
MGEVGDGYADLSSRFGHKRPNEPKCLGGILIPRAKKIQLHGDETLSEKKCSA